MENILGLWEKGKYLSSVYGHMRKSLESGPHREVIDRIYQIEKADNPKKKMEALRRRIYGVFGLSRLEKRIETLGQRFRNEDDKVLAMEYIWALYNP